MEVTQHTFGPYRYEHVCVKGLGHRINWHDQPQAGDKVRHWDDIETIRYIDKVGNIVIVNAKGCESGCHPGDIEFVSKSQDQ